MGNPRRQVLVDLSQIQQAHAGHAPVFAGGLGGGQVLGNVWLAGVQPSRANPRWKTCH